MIPRTGGPLESPELPLGKQFAPDEQDEAQELLGALLGVPKPERDSLLDLARAWADLAPELREAVLRVAGIGTAAARKLD